jgi:hypothetical protein
LSTSRIGKSSRRRGSGIVVRDARSGSRFLSSFPKWVGIVCPTSSTWLMFSTRSSPTASWIPFKHFRGKKLP